MDRAGRRRRLAAVADPQRAEPSRPRSALLLRRAHASRSRALLRAETPGGRHGHHSRAHVFGALRRRRLQACRHHGRPHRTGGIAPPAEGPARRRACRVHRRVPDRERDVQRSWSSIARAHGGVQPVRSAGRGAFRPAGRDLPPARGEHADIARSHRPGRDTPERRRLGRQGEDRRSAPQRLRRQRQPGDPHEGPDGRRDDRHAARFGARILGADGAFGPARRRDVPRQVGRRADLLGRFLRRRHTGQR